MPALKTVSALLLSVLATTVHAGVDAWLSPDYTKYAALFSEPLFIPPVKQAKYEYTNPDTGRVIQYYEVTINEFEQQLYPGLGKAKLVGYDGISPGPTFMMERGKEAIVRFINNATLANSVHLHGSPSMAPFDGWAEDVTKPGEYKDYYYPNSQKARTLWYHDHAVHHTAENAYYGQAGFYLLHDPAEDGLGLPKDKYDVALALSAKQYQSNGDLFSPASELVSLWGDVIHVNGKPWPYLNVEPRKYRFRLLDSSISRTFQLSFEDDSKAGTRIPFTMIGSDAGLLSVPVTTSTLDIAMAERWELIFDFSAYAGKNVTMKNGRDVQHDKDYPYTDRVMRFVVGKTVADTSNNGNPPNPLSALALPKLKTGVDRTFVFERKNSEWTVNGFTFSDVENRILAKPQRGATEVWQLENKSGGWSHPVHIHLVDFQVISRVDGKRGVQPYEKVALKDVVLLGENEKVQVLAKYAPWDGVYMFHCHNLIHEDHDMMAAFNVTSLTDWGYSDKTKFLDPMEDRWRAKPINDHDFEEEHIREKCFAFQDLDAYYHVDDAEKALHDYWATYKPSATASPIPATSAAPPSSGDATLTVPSASSVPVSPSASPITTTPVTVTSSTSPSATTFETRTTSKTSSSKTSKTSSSKSTTTSKN